MSRTTIDHLRPLARCGKAVALGLAPVSLCAIGAATIRGLVADDLLSDAASLVLTGGTLATILIAIVVTQRLAPAGSRGGASIALLAVGVAFAAASYIDVMVAAQSLMDAAEPDMPATIVALGPHGDDVRLSGEIRDGTAARLAALLDANPTVKRVALTSEGGLADEGEALRHVIAARRLTTYVPDFCVSACTLAFAGGRQRLVMENARLGFHAPFEEGLFGQTFAGDKASTRAAYLDAGVDAAFVERALDAAPADLWYPEPDQLVSAHVATAIVARDRLPDSNLDADPTPRGAREIVLRNVPVLKRLDVEAPILVQRIADWYLARYREEWSEARVVDGLHALSADAVSLAAAGADDPALVALAQFMARAMAVTSDEADCRAIGADGDLVTAVSVFGDDDAGAATTASTLVGATMEGRSAATIAAAGIAAPAASGDRRRESCAALRRAYARALSQHVHEAAALLRPRFAHWARRATPLLHAVITPASPAPHS